jgi:hypothetical protein
MSLKAFVEFYQCGDLSPGREILLRPVDLALGREIWLRPEIWLKIGSNPGYLGGQSNRMVGGGQVSARQPTTFEVRTKGAA